MLIFLDTEYTDPVNFDLISIGMVGEDGQRELYAERSDFQREWCSPFVQSSVLPLLGQYGPAFNKSQLSVQLKTWFLMMPRKVTIACDSLADWNLLVDALSGFHPANLIGRYDLRGHIDTAEFHQAVVLYHERSGPWHHALHDARAHRQGWLAWQDKRKVQCR